MQQSERFKRGFEKIEEIGKESGEDILARMEEVSPEFAQYVVEYAYGDIWSRPGLDLKSRKIATVAALAAMGTAYPQLKVHIRGALNNGVTREEIMEIMIHMSVYAGFPAAWNGIRTAKEVFAEMDSLAE